MKNLFEKPPSRRQECSKIKEKEKSLKNKIKKLKAPLGHLRTLSYTRLDNGTLRRLAAVGIDLGKLEKNIVSW